MISLIKHDFHNNRMKLFSMLFVAALFGFFAVMYIFYNPNTQQRSKAAGEVIDVTMDTQQNGSTYVMTLSGTPNADLTLRGYDLGLNFQGGSGGLSGGLMQITNIEYLAGVATSGIGDVGSDATTLAKVNGASRIVIWGEVREPAGLIMRANTPTPMVRVTFTSGAGSGHSIQFVLGTVANGSGFVRIAADSSLVSVPLGNTIYSGVTGSSTLSPTTVPITFTPSLVPLVTDVPSVMPTAVPTIDPTKAYINLIIRMQGIPATGPANGTTSMPVRIGVEQEGQSTGVSQNVTFQLQKDGTWRNVDQIGPFDPASNYKIFVKGPKHIQKRLCVNTPQETAPLTYSCSKGSINLAAGMNNIDAHGVVMPVGDLPEQDNIVDSYDIILIRQNLGQKGVDKCDVNFDGICDAQDYALVLATLTIKHDEE